MSICIASGKITIAMYCAHHPSTVKMHLGDGRGSRDTKVEFLNTTSTILKSLIVQYSVSKNRMSIWLVSGRISSAQFSAHYPSSVKMHLGDG